uniref:Lipid droplet-associated hydrolase n=1 Tax=Aceria tosichella TaxID=561515 RepID=A0A6G1SIC5_9ACAR
MSYPEVRHSHVKLNNSVTHLVQYGSNESFIKIAHQSSNTESLETISEQPSMLSSSSQTNNTTSRSKQDGSESAVLKQLIIFVPGNPGILGIYHDFLVSLYKTIVKPSVKNSRIAIVAMSHNNFDHPDCCNYDSSDMICIEDKDLDSFERSKANEYESHNVELQVLNKLIILRKLIKLDPNRYRVVFIGHSIGCYIILRLLQDKTVAFSHAGSILIHPALENLASTKKGTVIARYFNFKVDLAMRFAAYICELLLPNSLRLSLTKRFCSAEFVRFSSEIVLESIAQLGCSKAVAALVEMARSEFKQVLDIDHKTLIEPHASKLRLIYAIGDHWVNVESKQELLDCYPSLHIEEQPTLHAFIMDPQVMSDYAIKIGIMVQDCFD